MTVSIGDAPDGLDRRDEETLDRSVIAQFDQCRTAGAPPLVVALIDQFIAEAGAQVATLCGPERLDPAALKAMAHGLRGSSMMLGARRLGALCERIELSAGRDRAVSDALLSDLDQEFVRVRDALGAERQGAGER
jgi:HPt (histidine-containing phosphotransfer) domain-containing protein